MVTSRENNGKGRVATCERFEEIKLEFLLNGNHSIKNKNISLENARIL